MLLARYFELLRFFLGLGGKVNCVNSMLIKVDYSGLSEDDLIMKIANDKDLEAFSRLFEIYAPKIKALSLVKHPGENQLAEDLVQEVFEVIWKDAPEFKVGTSKVSTWIFTIVRKLRREERARSDDASLGLSEALDVLSTMESETPVASIEKHELEISIEEKIALLPREQYEVIVKTFMEGKTHSEAAEELNIPLGTVKTRIKLALSKLGFALKNV